MDGLRKVLKADQGMDQLNTEGIIGLEKKRGERDTQNPPSVVGHKKLIYYTASVCLTIYHSRHLDHIAIEGSVLIQAFNEVCR